LPIRKGAATPVARVFDFVIGLIPAARHKRISISVRGQSEWQKRQSDAVVFRRET
jgi:hypothetical protein